MSRHQNLVLSSGEDVKYALSEMGVDLYGPETKREFVMADAMAAFSSFVLEDEPQQCQHILENDSTGSVGELQGGSDLYAIYRVSIPDQDETRTYAVTRLLDLFRESPQGKRYQTVMTVNRLRQYMISMCHKRTRDRTDAHRVTHLGNFMLVFQFGGPTNGQVRHIDNMVPNVQICLYMSNDCPSTIVYELAGNSIHNTKTLIEHWIIEEERLVPAFLKQVLEKYADRSLDNKWYTKYFSFWGTINKHLECFGKLYQPVALQHSVVVLPGTTLLAGGNEVHAGPPTASSRMFAFAIGVPEELGDTEHNEDNNGEVQYSPVTNHLDFCCLLFSILDQEDASTDSMHLKEAKRFLLEVLVDLIRDHPSNFYLRQLSPNRSALLEWLRRCLDDISNESSVKTLIEQGTCSHQIFYTPDVVQKRFGPKTTRNRSKHREAL